MNRPRFRFNLRMMLVVVTLVGCWLGYSLNWIREREKLIGSFKLRCYEVGPAPWQLRHFGTPGFRVMRFYEPMTARDVERARGLFPEASRLEADDLDDMLAEDAPAAQTDRP